MEFIGRDDEVERIRKRVKGGRPSLTLLTGWRGTGKTTLLRHALAHTDTFWYQAAPLPDIDHRTLVRERLLSGSGGVSATEPPVEIDDWPDIFRKLALPVFQTLRPAVVVLDGWDRLVGMRRRLPELLTDFWLTVRRRGAPFHLFLVSPPGEALAGFREEAGPIAGWVDETIRLGPLPYRSIAALLPTGRKARVRLETCGVFGGMPEVVRHIDPSRTVEENVLSAVLGEDAPLRRWGTDLLERELQSAGRYASILRAVSAGRSEWSEIRNGVPDFGSSGQMAPYIQRLESMEIIESARSLDASPAARRTRYRMTDPFAAFWFRFVLPELTELELGRSREVWSSRIAPRLDEHLAQVFPSICREWLVRSGHERLPSKVAEVGGLWGKGYDIEIAGRLTNRIAFHGVARWGREPLNGDALNAIDRQVEHARYGLSGRSRHRILFGEGSPDAPLRARIEAEEELHYVSLPNLLGEV